LEGYDGRIIEQIFYNVKARTHWFLSDFYQLELHEGYYPTVIFEATLL